MEKEFLYFVCTPTPTPPHPQPPFSLLLFFWTPFSFLQAWKGSGGCHNDHYKPHPYTSQERKSSYQISVDFFINVRHSPSSLVAKKALYDFELSPPICYVDS